MPAGANANGSPLASGTGIGLSIALACACGGSAQQPAPSKLAEQSALVEPPARPKDGGAFDNPKDDPPGPRTPQIGADELEATLLEARGHVTSGKPQRAIPILHRCANKEPASARCDGELGIVLGELGTQRAHMRYFITQSAQTDDPKADADLYRRIAATARRRGLHDARADAMSILIARGVATAEDYAERAHALSADATKIREAIDALRLAHEHDPERHELLLEQGVLAAQVRDWAESARLIEAFLAAAPPDAAQRKAAQERLAVVQRHLEASKPSSPASP